MNLERRIESAYSSLGVKIIAALALAICLSSSLKVQAFSWSLQPEEIQNAYSLGQTSNHEDLLNFLKKYQHNLSYPQDKPFASVRAVEFETPYEQIVLRSQQRVGYSKFQAAEDYRANPRQVIVRVVAGLANGYAGPEPSADDFKVVVSQAKPIEPQTTSSTLLCNTYDLSAYSAAGNCAAYTREIILNFDARQFAHGNATVKTLLPGDHSQQTTFNLDDLK